MKNISGRTTSTAIPLYWVAYGDAARGKILLLHGGPGASHDYLLPQMLALAEKRQVILYDQRGGGQSEDDRREPVTWSTHVEDLAKVVAEFNLDPLTLVGYSWGALLAMLYTLDAVEGKSGGAMTVPARLILVSPAPARGAHRKSMHEEFTARQNSEGVQQAREELNASGLRETNPDAYRRRLFELSVMGYFHNPDMVRHLTQFRVSGRVQESVWKSLGDFDLLPRLGTLEIPTLVVHGRDDPIPVQSSLEIADALRARILVLERCGHVPYVEQPKALFSVMEKFLDDYEDVNKAENLE